MSTPDLYETLEALISVDRVVHEPARLVLMALLGTVARADFVYLRGQTGLTAGNISSHMKKLTEAGYVDVEKTYSDNRPQTIFSLTPTGREALTRYLETMHDVLHAFGD